LAPGVNNHNGRPYAEIMNFKKIKLFIKFLYSGFGGLGVSALAFGTQVRGFKSGRSRRI
jgi:hypothetical protein